MVLRVRPDQEDHREPPDPLDLLEVQDHRVPQDSQVSQVDQDLPDR